MNGVGLKNKKRLLALLITFTCMVLALLVRVAWIQIINGEWYQKKAFEQQTRDREITPKRGVIYDRNGKLLAISASVERIVVSPLEMMQSDMELSKIAEDLANILELDREFVLNRISRRSRYEVIKRQVDKEVGNLVRKWAQENKISGIYIDEDTKRFYPNRNLAAHVIGFTGYDNQGLDGIERMFEEYLKGVPGKILSEVDAGGREIPLHGENRINPTDGLNVVLTIDETIQYFATKALEQAIDDNKLLNGAVAIVMDPRNGDVLAMVSKPDYDLNTPRGAPEGVDPSTWKGTTVEDIKILQETVWRNKAVMDTYEPGSTFKAITTAAGLEEDVITLDTLTSDATIKVQGWDINCWRPNAHGVQPFLQSVYTSCNPVFVRIAQDLGLNTFYKYLRAFGFYDRTGITLPGEARSIFQPKPVEIDMAVASFGQRFQITPIQMITAYSTIANGGNLVQPRIVKELTNSNGTIVKKFEPNIVRSVISKQTSDVVREILEGVVSEGTGKNAYVKGYRVAGKTGTSETTQAGRYIASFAAFAPADNPVISVLVVLDYPTGHSYYGGQIAAPVAGRLIEDILRYLRVERRYTDLDREIMAEEVFIPDVRNKTVSEAQKMLRDFEMESRVAFSGAGDSIVIDQVPKPGVSIPKGSIVLLYTQTGEQKVQVRVPNILNKTIAEAIQELNRVGLNIKLQGRGVVINQTPTAGQMVEKGTIVEVEFKHLDTD